MYYDQPQDESLWAVDHQFMFGSDILVCPKVIQKFILPQETVQKTAFRKVVMEVKNENEVPIYEISPMFPEVYYDWNTKQ